MNQPQTPSFVHPAEEMFARVMDYYGVRWIYEPRTFDLEWDANGKVTLAFTPDFYLPDQDLYVELTTLRPQLSTKKNKKMRLMAELYPNINIKLMKRREMRDLMVKYGLYDQAEHIQGTQAQKKAS
ncbi:MAG: PDDEXK family nuclease [Bellilinea sp.]